MQVLVERLCGRCPKKTEVMNMSLDEAQALQQSFKDAAKVHEALRELLREELENSPCPPDLLIAYQAEEGTYRVRTLDSLCSSGKSGGCKARTLNLIKEIFLEAPRKEPKSDATVEDTGVADEDEV